MGDGMVWHSCYYTPLNFNRNEACANIIFLLARCGRKITYAIMTSRDVLSARKQYYYIRLALKQVTISAI